MKKKLLIFVIIIAGIALSGIIYVQISYMQNAYAQNETLFDYKVNDALQSMVKNLDQKAIVEKIQVELKKNRLKPKKEIKRNIPVDVPIDSFFSVSFNDTLLKHIIMPGMHRRNDFPVVLENEDEVFVYSDFNDNTNHQVVVSSGKYTKIPGIRSGVYVSNGDTGFFKRGIKFNNQFEFALDTIGLLEFRKDIVKKKEKEIQTVVQKMVTESDNKTVREIKTLNYGIIDSLLKVSLHNQDIDLNYEYKVTPDVDKDKKAPYTAGFEMDNKYKKYETRLYPNDIVPKNDKIILYFPDRKTHLIKSLSILLPSSLIFSFIIIIAFTISIMMVLRQKKISDIKTDFINNMTHEFKTPIATISLAADTIVNDKVIGDKERVGQFIRIIKDENKRMNTQVERILQMALLERKEMGLKLERLDIHQLLSKVLSNIDVQVSQMNGRIISSFNALDSDVMVDEIHFTNVFNNLLDNALKYTSKPPKIEINTSQLENGINVSFADNGIGMTKEAQLKIFDKFYRVSKGNIHNVKGFGLGLSYVKAIVEAHGGRISVKSELEKGSRFDIFIPQKLNGNGKSASYLFG